MRDRAWRKYKEDCKVKYRLIGNMKSWWRCYDSNSNCIDNPQWFDYLRTSYHYKFKNAVSPWRDKDKIKYGKKGRRSYGYSSSPFTRVKDKAKFIRMLDREYGLKRLNTKQQPELGN